MQWMKKLQLASKPWVNKPLQVNTELQLYRHAAVSSPTPHPPTTAWPKPAWRGVCVCERYLKWCMCVCLGVTPQATSMFHASASVCDVTYMYSSLFTSGPRGRQLQSTGSQAVAKVWCLDFTLGIKGRKKLTCHFKMLFTIMHIHCTGNIHVFPYDCIA